MATEPAQPIKSKKPSLIALVMPYKSLIGVLIVLTIIANGLNLLVPKMMASGIDSLTQKQFLSQALLERFGLVVIGILVFTIAQNIVQEFASACVSRDLRNQLAGKISTQDYASIQQITPATLLTNLTSDIDSVKNFVSQAIVAMISSIFLIIGSSVLLLYTNWRLALIVLTVVPFIGGMFFLVFRKVRKLFRVVQEAIDWLNKVINESILGAALIRLLNAENIEYKKFEAANLKAKTVSMKILRLFASLNPIVGFGTNMATLAILMVGGHYVMTKTMTLGDFTAFNAYLAILIFPIITLGFISNMIAQASASYGRVCEVLMQKDRRAKGEISAKAGGDIQLKNVSVMYGEKYALKDVSFSVKAGSKTAIIGPTAAGKTQLLYLLTGLISPQNGQVDYAQKSLEMYDPVSLHQQIAFVFQDSVIFNLTLRENIAFSDAAKDEDLAKAIETAELRDFIDALPEKLDTVVSERGTSLSGGQKQRIMLARALALNPSVLLLDDFTARVDVNTEKRILENVERNYPNITLISVTQKVASVQHYDQIVLLMEGELLAKGTHKQLMKSSPDYVQIYESQRSTASYELLAE